MSGMGYLPGVGINHICVEGIYLAKKSITLVSGVDLPATGPNPFGVGGIYLQQKPIPFVSGVSIWSRNQSHLCRGYRSTLVPGVSRTSYTSPENPAPTDTVASVSSNSLPGTWLGKGRYSFMHPST